MCASLQDALRESSSQSTNTICLTTAAISARVLRPPPTRLRPESRVHGNVPLRHEMRRHENGHTCRTEVEQRFPEGGGFPDRRRSWVRREDEFRFMNDRCGQSQPLALAAAQRHALLEFTKVIPFDNRSDCGACGRRP
jgi:hypothetical protein